MLFLPLRNSHHRWVGQRRSGHHLELGIYGSMKRAVSPAWGDQEDLEQRIPELTLEGGTGLKLGRALQTQRDAGAEAGVYNGLSWLSFPQLVSSPSLLFLGHVKIKDKPGKNSSIHKARKSLLALLFNKFLSRFLDKYCDREPVETWTKD